MADGTERPPSDLGHRGLTRRAVLTSATGAAIAGGIGSYLGRAGSTPEPIDDWYDLAAIDGAGDDYALASHLDATTPGYADLASSGANGGSGWAPIEFTGTLDGQGHVIADVVIDRTGTGGVFAEIVGGSLTTIGVVDVEVSAGSSTGGLVGENNGGTIEACLVGGSISGSDTVGGLVGKNFGTIVDCYSLAEVSGSSDVGGIAGLDSGSIERVYAAGAVSGSDDVGGLVGVDNFGGLADAYYDRGMTTQASAIGDSPDPGSVVGYGDVSDSEPATELTGEDPLPVSDGGDDTMGAFDFDSVWTPVVAGVSNGVTPASDGYPLLQAVDARHQLEAQGIAELAAAAISIESSGSVHLSNVTIRGGE